jgi:hypothetical protein
MSATVPGPMPGGLLQATPADLASLAPPPAYHQPAMSMTAGNLRLGTGGSFDALMPGMFGDDDAMPDPLRAYQAGLQPYIAPAGTPWQEEIVFDRIARTDADIQTEMLYYFSAAQNYDSALSAERMTASHYYNARPLGDEETGRSQIVLSTVRDTIRATLPSLLRIFTAVENPVEFAPAVADNEQLGLAHAELARQATQYCSWALFTANPGWIVLHDAILDALTRKIGWVRWYWGQQRAQRVEECDRLLLPQLQALLQEPGITAQRIVRRPMLPNEIRAVSATPEGMAFLQAGNPPQFYAARITRAAARAWPIVEAVPPECVWTVADADRPGEARALFHVRDVPVSDLIAAGLPREAVLRAASLGTNQRQRQEAVARDPVSGGNWRGAPPNDPAMKIVRYTEGWCRMDTDGDNIAELIHLHAVGSTPQVIRWDRTDEIPLAGFTPYREPGRIIGFSQADMVMDLQRTETRVLRAVLDSLGQAIFPRTVVQVGAVNVEDARQTAIGAIIRVTQQGAVTELAKPFVGAQALPVLEVLEAVRESRTGITRTSQGLTAESLQSTTPAAVSAQTDAAQDRIDMIARTLAETGLVPLYQGLLRMMARHQDRPNVLSLRGKWITVDPRALSIMWEVKVNIGGKGTPAERLAMLNAIAAKQEQILAPAVAQGLLDTPLVGLAEYRNTLGRMCEVTGISDVVSYFKELPPGWQPPPKPPPAPTTDQVLAQVETMKTQADIADDTRQSATDRLKIALDDERSRDEAAVSAWVSAYATAAQYNTPLPSIAEFKTALKSDIPLAALLGAAPPAGAPIPQPGPSGVVVPALGLPAGVPAGRGVTAAGPPGMVIRPGPVPVPVPQGALPPAPVALPPNATPPGVTPGMDPASVLAMRRALLNRNAGGIATSILGNRALLGQNG